MPTQYKPFTVKQLADRWSVSPSYVYKLIAEKKLNAFPLGGALKRITYQEVERWENAGNQPLSTTTSDNTGSAGSSINSASSGMMGGSVGAIDLVSQRRKKREQSFMRLRDRT